MNIQVEWEWDGSRLTPHFAAKASQEGNQGHPFKDGSASSGRRQVLADSSLIFGSCSTFAVEWEDFRGTSVGISLPVEGHTKDLPFCLQGPRILTVPGSHVRGGGNV